LRTLKNASKLRRLSELKAVIDQDTRWDSVYAMLVRYLELLPFLTVENFGVAFAELLPSYADNRKLSELAEELKNYRECSLALQSDAHLMNLYEVRGLFDKLCEKYPVVERTLGRRSQLIQDPVFENAVVKIQGGLESTLTPAEKNKVKHYLIEAEEGEDEAESNFAQTIIDRAREAKRMRVTKASKYRQLDHILPTSNIVERLFSRAKIIMADRRKSMTPYHLELLLFLRMNKDLWSEREIQEIIDASTADLPPDDEVAEGGAVVDAEAAVVAGADNEGDNADMLLVV
jgi:hypothetical protein